MSECCREKFLNEYIEELNIDENVKRRMLDLYKREKTERIEQDKYLNNCQKRIRELEQTVVELGTELGRMKSFIREHL